MEVYDPIPRATVTIRSRNQPTATRGVAGLREVLPQLPDKVAPTTIERTNARLKSFRQETKSTSNYNLVPTRTVTFRAANGDRYTPAPITIETSSTDDESPLENTVDITDKITYLRRVVHETNKAWQGLLSDKIKSEYIRDQSNKLVQAIRNDQLIPGTFADPDTGEIPEGQALSAGFEDLVRASVELRKSFPNINAVDEIRPISGTGHTIVMYRDKEGTKRSMITTHPSPIVTSAVKHMKQNKDLSQYAQNETPDEPVDIIDQQIRDRMARIHDYSAQFPQNIQDEITLSIQGLRASDADFRDGNGNWIIDEKAVRQRIEQINRRHDTNVVRAIYAQGAQRLNPDRWADRIPQVERMSEQEVRQLNLRINNLANNRGLTISENQRAQMHEIMGADHNLTIDQAYDIVRRRAPEHTIDQRIDNFARDYGRNLSGQDRTHMRELITSGASPDAAHAWRTIVDKRKGQPRDILETSQETIDFIAREKREQEEKENRIKEEKQARSERITENMTQAYPIFEMLNDSGHTSEAQALRDAILQETNHIYPAMFIDTEGNPKDAEMIIKTMKLYGLLEEEPNPIQTVGNLIEKTAKKYGFRFVKNDE